MATSNKYAFFRPDTLDTAGYAYGKAISEAQRGKIEVEQALSGVGTYVGCALCIARVPEGQPKIWDYGVVVGYTWDKATHTGVLQVTFVDGTSELPYGKEEQQDLVLETYALRPCSGRSVADVMPAEMRAIHNAVHDHFNGIGQPARRSSSTVLRKVDMAEIDCTRVQCSRRTSREVEDRPYPKLCFLH
ncbi:hypothetical protein PHYSODRAFT_485275 [Phytophthora sojae]|uniref:Uncharacterized protein n=1 Tax=Phytophthora sojae (strain P6497) TaxID=1094619 RepID=G4YUW2_PHYSP|nr:hypothetical protein PHYSODRAFT_485275 [Phytophthora sojae]EGZ23128.1 hypothetical protein PHYSODRAFT_485275 [Phytophthora sojae]|eukprot:XP_009518416.1 hypothetical protein PHYSODRAFT_485275 [Phytophthora sojae]